MVMSSISDTSMAGSRCSVSHSSQVSRNAPSAGTGVIPAATNASETRTPSTLPRLYREGALAALRWPAPVAPVTENCRTEDTPRRCGAPAPCGWGALRRERGSEIAPPARMARPVSLRCCRFRTRRAAPAPPAATLGRERQSRSRRRDGGGAGGAAQRTQECRRGEVLGVRRVITALSNAASMLSTGTNRTPGAM